MTSGEPDLKQHGRNTLVPSPGPVAPCQLQPGQDMLGPPSCDPNIVPRHTLSLLQEPPQAPR